MRHKDKTVLFRLERHLYEHVQGLAAALGLSVSEYMRLVACWPSSPYLLVTTEVQQILQSSEDPELAVPLLRNALARLDAGLAQLDPLIEQIEATAPAVHRQGRAQVLALRAQLEERLTQFGAWSKAFSTLRKQLGEPPAPGTIEPTRTTATGGQARQTGTGGQAGKAGKARKEGRR